MSWLFGKEKKEEKGKLPELPVLPEPPIDFKQYSPDKYQFKEELPLLPAFPTSLSEERMSNSVTKQSLKENYESQIQAPIMTRELDEFPRAKPMKVQQKFQKQEPLFVRIDKYQDAISNLQEAKKKILEIEQILREIKDVKSREETELNSWTTELQEVKAKLDGIDRTIFQKLE